LGAGPVRRFVLLVTLVFSRSAPQRPRAKLPPV